MRLISSNIANFKVAKEFCNNTAKINSIDFSQDGSTFITSSDDDSIIIYDCEKGTVRRTLQSKKYGVGLISLTHTSNTAIHTSNKIDETIRYLSLPDNKYLRYFHGHTKRVVTLCMSPTDDIFLSGSMDKTIRLWDLKGTNCIGIMQTQGRPVANFDPEGLIFAVGINSEFVKLYDLRSFDKGPFNTFKVDNPKQVNWMSLSLSPNGKQILITTYGNTVHTIDSFTGYPHLTLTTNEEQQICCDTCYSPDSRFIFAGTNDGSIHVFDAESSENIAILKGGEMSPVQCVKFNPKFMMLASACTKTSFWIPTNDENKVDTCK